MPLPAVHQTVLPMPWGQVEVDFVSHQVMVRQHWAYRWELMRGAQPWTMAEQQQYHARIERALVATFHGARLTMATRVRRRKEHSSLGLSLQALFVPEGGAHWVAHVRRVPPDCQVPLTAHVNPALLSLSLTEHELSAIEAARNVRRICMPLLLSALNEHFPGRSFLA